MKDHNELLLFFIIIVFVVDIDVMLCSYTVRVTRNLCKCQRIEAFSMQL